MIISACRSSIMTLMLHSISTLAYDLTKDLGSGDWCGGLLRPCLAPCFLSENSPFILPWPPRSAVWYKQMYTRGMSNWQIWKVNKYIWINTFLRSYYKTRPTLSLPPTNPTQHYMYFSGVKVWTGPAHKSERRKRLGGNAGQHAKPTTGYNITS